MRPESLYDPTMQDKLTSALNSKITSNIPRHSVRIDVHIACHLDDLRSKVYVWTEKTQMLQSSSHVIMPVVWSLMHRVYS